jgi:hypothetical protein
MSRHPAGKFSVMAQGDPEGRRVLSDVEAFNHAVTLDSHAVVRELVDLLGLTAVAVLGDVGETRSVQRWMDDREPRRGNELRFALQLALMLTSRADSAIARSWFQATNPQLGDRAPIFMLRDRPLRDIEGPLLEAARSFAGRL